MKETLNKLLPSPPGQQEPCIEAERLTCSSLTIIKHRSLSSPFRPKVPKVVWISEKRRLLVTSWWVFISYQVFSWSMWQVILKEKQTLRTQSSSEWVLLRIVGRHRIWASDGRNDGYAICVLTSVPRHPAYLTVKAQWARKATFSEITFSCPMPGHWCDRFMSMESGCCLEPSGGDKVGFGCQAGRCESPVFSPQGLSFDSQTQGLKSLVSFPFW